MLKKKLNKKKGVVEVTFVLPAEVAGEAVYVVGDFNEWQNTHPMKQQTDGSWKLTVELSQIATASSATWSTRRSGSMTRKLTAIYPTLMAKTIPL